MLGWLPLTIAASSSDCQPDSSPSQLTPQEPQLCLVDAGYFLNTSCPSMFRPGRRLDLILSFDYSLSSPFEVPLLTPREPQSLCPARPHSRGEKQGQWLRSSGSQGKRKRSDKL